MAEAKKKGRKKGSSNAHGRSTTGKVRDVPADQSNWRVKLQQSRIKFDDDQKQVYCQQLAEHGMKGRAAMAADTCRQTVANHMENDPDFAEAVEAALQEYRDMRVEKWIGELAYEGVLVESFDKEGNCIKTKREYPIRLIELELKRIDPGYRDKQTLDLNHGGGVMVAPAGMTPEQWIAEQEKANADKQKPGPEGKAPEGAALVSEDG